MPETDASIRELADLLARRVATTLVIAAGIIGLAIYARPAPPRYDVAVGDGRIVRIDRRSGTVISCDPSGCGVVLRHGQRVDRRWQAAPPAQPKALPQPQQPTLPAQPATVPQAPARR